MWVLAIAKCLDTIEGKLQLLREGSWLRRLIKRSQPVGDCCVVTRGVHKSLLGQGKARSQAQRAIAGRQFGE